MLSLMKKVISMRWALRSLPYSIFFNFYYLPLKQAVKLPILLYKPTLLKLKGTVAFDSSVHIKTGMVKLGLPKCSLYPNSGIIWENKGGDIVFFGSCIIGNSSAVSVGSRGRLFFGDRFKATTSFRIVAYDTIRFGEKVEFGWDCLVFDSDFHKMTKLDGGYTKGYGPIILGSNVWVGSKTVILKNTTIPDYCTVAAGSQIHGFFKQNYSVIGNSMDCTVLRNGLWRNIDDDLIVYG